MNSRSLIGLAVLAAILLAAFLLWDLHVVQSQAQYPVVTASQRPSPAIVQAEGASASPVRPLPASPASIKGAVSLATQDQGEAAIVSEETRLQQLGVNDDPVSYAAILKDLTSPEREIRLAAIEATKQFGNRDAISVLKTAAARTTDQDERTSFLNAADFLALPTIAEVTQRQQLPPPPEQGQGSQKRSNPTPVFFGAPRNN